MAAQVESVSLGVTLSDLQVSDLFFNYGVSSLLSQVGLVDDATAFAEAVGKTGDKRYIAMLVQDFKDRV
jgi:hypothetical protein